MVVALCLATFLGGRRLDAQSTSKPFAAGQEVAPSKDPFANNNGALPPSSYQGPLFKLSHDWPSTPPAPPAQTPWQRAIGGGLITKANASAYVAALKSYVAPSAKKFLGQYQSWNAGNEGWYNQPWVGAQRESIRGTYTGTSFPPSTFAGTGLKKSITTYVLTFYDKTASVTLSRVWGAQATQPQITTANSQFPENSVIIKYAFVNVTANDWPVLKGTTAVDLFVPINDKTNNPQVAPCSLMQLDIIVKDSKSAPKTGWVFSTLVFDTSKSDPWEAMVPLGAMWGNDPDVTSDYFSTNAPLKETWINPAAPPYSTITLGWGGRLSGPNDDAVNDIQVPRWINHQFRPQTIKNARNSACMSCHSPAEWPLKSFILPSMDNPHPQFTGQQGQYLVSPPAGSEKWMEWFQDRSGKVPKDSDSIAFDYDMVFAFKSLQAWAKAQGQRLMQIKMPHRPPVEVLDLQYNGLPKQQ